MADHLTSPSPHHVSNPRPPRALYLVGRSGGDSLGRYSAGLLGVAVGMFLFAVPMLIAPLNVYLAFTVGGIGIVMFLVMARLSKRG